MVDLVISFIISMKITIPIMVGVTLFALGYTNPKKGGVGVVGFALMVCGLIAEFGVLYLFAETAYLG